ncbi:hypothetical protein [Lonepinella koalarum]|uniref:Uncharacterized protein n=1 Tax=Lonepinella koalarum TaxID=53417 RepID=A0A4R1KKT7_9PAST|nr:hypothetical protein [Lonepinella koalarum]TCK64933.1 hypothetical protein EV692_2418 [Lonepinella koalarum]
MFFETTQNSGVVVVYTPYITKNGKRIYRKNGGMFRFEVPANEYRCHI